MLPEQNHTHNYRFALVFLTFLFFMWGFITCLNDILIPYLKASFELNYTQAMLIQFCFFGAYFLVSLPAGALVEKIGYQKGIVIGLLTASLGCMMFFPAAEYQVYGLFLLALFVLAAGITLLQVSANPYVTALGKPETAASRLTMTQAFNSLGTTVAPFFGVMFIFAESQSHAVSSADGVKVPYLMLAGCLLILALLFIYIKLPQLNKSEQAEGSFRSVLNIPHLRLGVLAIFLYVGAEVAIGSFLVNFLAEPDIANMNEATAAKYIAYYWGGAMVGRFIGAAVMRTVPAGKVLAFNALAAVILLLVTVMTNGALAMWAVLAIGLCNSIMFPTIFSLALHGLGRYAEKGSGLLCLAIVGGAIVPVLQGKVADMVGVQLAFLLPVLCYLYIAFYGVKGHQVDNNADAAN